MSNRGSFIRLLGPCGLSVRLMISVLRRVMVDDGFALGGLACKSYVVCFAVETTTAHRLIFSCYMQYLGVDLKRGFPVPAFLCSVYRTFSCVLFNLSRLSLAQCSLVSYRRGSSSRAPGSSFLFLQPHPAHGYCSCFAVKSSHEV